MIARTGDRVEIYNVKDSKVTIVNKFLYLDNDFTISLSSSFQELIPSEGLGIFNQITSAISLATKGKFSISTSYKEFGLHVWQKTDPLSFNFTVSLHRITNSYFDVFLPAKKLMKIPLPIDMGNNKEGIRGLGLLPPGPNTVEILSEGKYLSSGYLYKIKIGQLRFYPVMIKKVEPTFSLDIDDTGYPVKCTLSIDAQGVYTATTTDIDRMDNYMNGATII